MKTEILELIKSQEKERGQLAEKERDQLADKLKKEQEKVEKMKKLAEGYIVENDLLKQELTNNNERKTGVRERKTRKSKAAAKYLFYLHSQM